MGADMNSETKECCERIWGDYHSHKCSRPAKFEVDGKLYCGIHNPNRGPTKAQIQAETDRQERQRIYRLNRAAPDLLEAMEQILKIKFSNWSDGEMRNIAKNAIKKATGETT
jgi:uncharacterized Zn finger protein (UPF0148 family)